LFSKRLRDLVKLRGFSISDLAEKSNLPKRRIDKWVSLTNPTEPSSGADLVALANALDTSVEYLVTGVSPKWAPFRLRDIVADLETLPESQLDAVRRLVRPWAEEARGIDLRGAVSSETGGEAVG
jgi:transcriptional regulator with XRE-family HTH domain